MIPRIIHQTWKTADIPDRFIECQASWRAHHPDWTYMFWTDADIDAFVETNYPGLTPLFRAYPDQIQRVDAVRYLILFSYGGVYADLDVKCLRSFESLRSKRIVLPQTKPVGVSNDLMGCEPASPFFATLIERLEPAYRRWQRPFVPRHLRVLLTTGSLFLTCALRSGRWRESVFVLPRHLYGDGGHAQSYVSHVPGATWHKWDSDFFVFLFTHARLIGFAALAIVAAVLWFAARP